MILDDAAHANLLRRLRFLLLSLQLFGAVSLLAELWLAEHWAQVPQRIPLVILGTVILATLIVMIRPDAALLRAFRVLMVITMLAGGAGVLLHFRGNAISQRTLDPTLQGPALVESALFGGTPALAPLALIQLGLLGLVAVYRHPGRRKLP